MAASQASITWTLDHGKINQARALFPGVITAEMHPRGPHLSRLFAIQRVSFHAFYNAFREIRSRSSIYDLTVTIFLKRSIVDRFIVTVDRNDRTVTIFRPIYTDVLHDSKHPS